MPTSVVTQILEAVGPSCRDTGRRARLLAQTALNGIDFVEFEIVGGKNILHAHFLLVVPTAAAAYGLNTDPSSVHVHGGRRIVGITVTNVRSTADPYVLDVEVSDQGDFSPYLLSIGWKRDPNGTWRFAFDDIDRLFSVAPVNFRPGCPVDFDCAPANDCPPEMLPEPALDYLARDYASFRGLLLDVVAQRNPAWMERSPADVGIALLELFAHEGDHLAYFQDAVANEAFLDTARQRESAKRHAKLVDYRMHDGRNAWAFVHLGVSAAGTVPAGVQLLTKVDVPMRFDRQPGVVPVPQPLLPPGVELNVVTNEDYKTDPALARVRVFETTKSLEANPLLNELRLHTWGNEQCCLPRGATTAHVYAIEAGKAVRPPIQPGDYLLLEEVLGPETGAAVDADPTHRVVVCIDSVNPVPSTVVDGIHDGLFLATIDPATHDPEPVVTSVPVAQMLPLVEVTWRPEDALEFPLCLSTTLKDGTHVHRVSVARGNIALADHGRTITEQFTFVPSLTADSTFRLRLGDGPLTMRCASDELTCDVRAAAPAVSLAVTHANGVTDGWTVVPDLLSSPEFFTHFVADVDDVGRGVLRFGDGEYGQRLLDVTSVVATYRMGNGRAGNIGADSLAHIVKPFPPVVWPGVLRLRNPLPSTGGEDAELIEQVRQFAPAAFRATQLRAVTEDDYRKAAITIKGVSDAVASFRWTGSWYTVFVGIDPADPDHVLTDARGITRLEPEFKQRVLESLTRFRLAGYDLEIRSARYVPLDVAIEVCAKRGYFPGDVAHAASLAVSSDVFSPAKLTFGQPVYLSRIYAAVEAVEGVESATVTGFHPHGRDPNGELASGRIPIGAWEIARLDNDPSNMENGTLTVTAKGGS